MCVGRLVRAPEFEPSFKFFLNEEHFGLAVLTQCRILTVRLELEDFSG